MRRVHNVLKNSHILFCKGNQWKPQMSNSAKATWWVCNYNPVQFKTSHEKKKGTANKQHSCAYFGIMRIITVQTLALCSATTGQNNHNHVLDSGLNESWQNMWFEWIISCFYFVRWTTKKGKFRKDCGLNAHLNLHSDFCNAVWWQGLLLNTTEFNWIVFLEWVNANDQHRQP